ncbi:chab domain protein 2 [Spilosoma obliqua nucleopolyhedrosis virus]|uniref:ORF92 peptide n=1 Tax=Hyphantria cunea nuclear polyhedrosis virus TaxID=28288 RepID=Q2NP19_NPVHC|nr:ORF92 peptide [Hyphantria cunea nucleopolyhedrovirus]AUR45117.1 chab domain protein 2 [Spilosoma obliqua nucleopolyhedrosis virus]BAE72381.1 ORF92 peptide [Hyphantria cunea nucleopolyhedrovirus]
MYHLPDTLYEEEKMPRRAKKLFVDTFSHHHKLNAGDEDVAMQKARQALEERYVRVNDLQWIPRRAAYEIIRDAMSSDSDRPVAASPPPTERRNKRRSKKDKRRVSPSSNSSDSSDNNSTSSSNSDDELVSTTTTMRPLSKKRKKVGKVVESQKFGNKSARQQYSTDDEY